jgi:hypothetical protein
METRLGLSPFETSLTGLAGARVLGPVPAGGAIASSLAGEFSPPAVRDMQQGDAIATSNQLASFRSLASLSSPATAPASNNALALLGAMPQMPALQLPAVQPRSNGNQNQPQPNDLIPFGIDLGGDDD